MEELAKRLNVKNILVTHINNDYYKDDITIIINDDLLINLVGKTFSFIPLSENGIGKRIPSSSVSAILNAIRKELNGKTI